LVSVSYDLHDTIVAIASAPGGAARGIVRLSGPDAARCVAASWMNGDGAPLDEITEPTRVSGTISVASPGRSGPLVVPGDLLLWPNERSYTRQPSAEFHTLGSPPLLAAIVDELCRHGCRPAAPGEFTLRAFLGGRIDLTQAEAVMGVVGSRSPTDLDRALDQLAGGLSRPLRELREDLLAVLGEIEAGLDFAEEPIEFIPRAELCQRLLKARQLVQETLEQLAARDRPADLPRVALTGPPNAGKSSLFNSLVERFGAAGGHRAIVSPVAGTTRDFVAAVVEVEGLSWELVDVAGDDATVGAGGIACAAQELAASQRQAADLLLECRSLADATPNWCAQDATPGDVLAVATKWDLAPARGAPSAVACSSVTGAGIDPLAREIRRRLAAQVGQGGATAAPSARSKACLRDAERALTSALALVDSTGDELLAAEVLEALNAIGAMTGEVCADDVLDRVFSQFCIGK
jgi:tRNA modification GTPase